MAAIFFIGRVLLRPVFRVISSSSGQQNSEIFVASTILVVLVAAYATEHMGLSMVLGAFFAGIMVAETEFRVAAEESIYPFKSILLGLFFMSVGMTIDIKEVMGNLWTILAISFVLVAVKTSVIYVLCRFFKFPKGKALHTGFILSQGSEFAFILFEIAGSYGIIEEEISDILLLVVTLTMAITPLLSFIGQKLKEVLDSGLATDAVGSVDFSSNDLSKSRHYRRIWYGRKSYIYYA
jgi:CPA2 family monovalent cation:H+ antiporter-2